MWGIVFGLLILMQWPMLKGWYYRVAGTPLPPGTIAWRSGFDAALAESHQTGKPVLLDFTASWCPPCQVMKHEVWPDKGVGDLINRSYVPVMADVDLPATTSIAERYGIRSIPAIVIVDSDGKVLRQARFMGRDGMLDFLKQGG